MRHAAAPIAALLFLPAALLAEPQKPDAQMQAVLDEFAKLGPKPIESLTTEEARKQPTPADAVKSLLKKKNGSAEPEPVGGVKNMTSDGPAGKLPVRAYTPKGDGPFPVVVYWHGGGFVLADIDASYASCRALCNATGAIVASCEYRRAPEHRFPAAAGDALALYKWVLKNAADWNGDPKRVAVAGESAGGNLAAVVCIQARDTATPVPVHQLLVYPVTNNNFDTPSYADYADAKPLNKPMMKWFFSRYVGGRPPGPYAVPLQVKDLSKLPPATIINAEVDPLRDDGKLYAEALQKAGVKVERKVYDGVTHEFFGMGAVVDKAKDAVAFGAAGLKSAFGK